MTTYYSDMVSKVQGMSEETVVYWAAISQAYDEGVPESDIFAIGCSAVERFKQDSRGWCDNKLLPCKGLFKRFPLWVGV